MIGQPSLPEPTRGVLWMIGGSVFYTLSYYAVRELSPKFTSFELVFYRALLTVIVMLPWVLRPGLAVLKTRRYRLYGFRSLVTFAGMVCLFFGIAHLPLADTTAILFTSPLFTVLFTAVTLGDPVGRRRMLAIAFGFAGSLLVIRPGFTEISWPILAVVCTTVTYGAANASTRALSRTENPNAMVFYMFAILLPLSAGPAIYYATEPAWPDLPWILLLGVTTVLSQQCVTRAYANAPAAVVTPAYYPAIANRCWDRVPRLR